MEEFPLLLVLEMEELMRCLHLQPPCLSAQTVWGGLILVQVCSSLLWEQEIGRCNSSSSTLPQGFSNPHPRLRKPVDGHVGNPWPRGRKDSPVHIYYRILPGDESIYPSLIRCFRLPRGFTEWLSSAFAIGQSAPRWGHCPSKVSGFSLLSSTTSMYIRLHRQLVE